MVSNAQTLPIATVQLRRYHIEAGRLADFVAWFPAIRPVREKFGFRILFALADAEHEIFTWAVAVDGDKEAFAAVETAYNDSPDRVAAFESNPQVVSAMELAFVTDVLAG